MLFTAPIVLVAAVAAVSASPVESRAKIATVPLTRLSTVKSAKTLVEKGQARLRNFNGVKDAEVVERASSGAVTNEDVSYVAAVTIGGSSYDLIVDTGCTLLP